MSNFKYTTVLIGFIFCLLSNVNAKEYAGVNLCSKTNAESIVKIGEMNDASVTIEDADESWPGVETILFSRYSLGEMKVDVEVQLINGVVDYIKIDGDFDLIKFIDAKYGKSIGPRTRNELFKNTKVWTYKTSKVDPDLLLTFEASEPSYEARQIGLTGLYGSHFVYQCKKTIGKANAQKDKAESEKIKGKLKKSNL